ncbi:MAG: alanyl-tRNA editing protein [Lachnospiraceae bacterium]|nr:alanyl-tRNA editing protein [Lachnospiraceae bacterium]
MRKLFYEDINQTGFTATVISCEPDDKKKCYRILLDATAFFPEEGGQTADKGTLNGLPVSDVQIENDLIYHFVAEPLTIGSTVTGQVDWEQRFDFMQQHSGEHIISGLVHKHFGYNNVGFHLSVNEVTLDFDGVLTAEQLREIELLANEAVYRNLPIEISYPDKETLASLSYRSKIELNGQVRIVTIPGVDVCACCAPHTATTGAIGIIKITNCQSHRGGVRLNILCGRRALMDYNKKQDSVTAVSVALSAKQDRVAEAVLKLKDDILRQKERTNALQAQYLSMCISTLPKPSETEHAVLFVDSMDTIALRNAVNELAERYTGYCAVFSGSDTEGYQFIAGSSHADCKLLADTLRKELGAKGGGSPSMIQGSVKAAKEQIEACINGELLWN